MADEHPATLVADPGTRGDLVVRDRAVQRIAEQAARTVTGGSGTGTSIPLLRRRGLPSASVDVRGRSVWISVEVGARWPCRLTHVAQQVRAAVADETRRIAGLEPREVDVTVHLEHDDDTTGRRVE